MPGMLSVDRPAEASCGSPSQSREAERARPRDPRRITDTVAEHDDARCLLLTGAGSMFSAGYDLGDLPEDELRPAAEALVAHPFPTRSTRSRPPTSRPSPRSPATRSAAASSSRWSATSRIAAETAKLGMPPAKLGLVYSHTGLRRFIDAIGVAARVSCSYSAGTSTRPRAWTGAWSTTSSRPRTSRRHALSLAAKLAANAPLSLRGNKRVLRELLAAEGELDPAIAAELVELRRSCFHTEDFYEGVRAFAEKRPPRWQGR